jgi:hypothetical protein
VESGYGSGYLFLSKIAIYLSVGFLKGRSRYRRSLQPSKENFSNQKRTLKNEILTCFYFYG